MQELGRLVAIERAGAAAEQEAWTTQAGYHKDGAGGNGIPGRCAESGDQDERD